MHLLDWVTTELRDGCPSLQGARVSVVVPLRRAVLEELLPLVPGLPTGVAIVPGADQRVQVRYGAFTVDARLRPAIELSPAPVLTLELASQLVAWGLQRAPLPPFVRLAGRAVHVRLAEIPALQPFAALWPLVERLTCTTNEGGFELSASLHVTSTAAVPSAPTRPASDQRAAAASEPAIGAWARRQLASGLPAFAGARLTALVPMPVAVLNELVAGAVAGVAGVPPTPSAPESTMGLDVAQVARYVRHVRLQAAPDVVTFDVELGVDG